MTRTQKLRDVAEHVGSRRDVHDTVRAFVAVVSDATAAEIARLSTKSIDEVRAVLRGMRCDAVSTDRVTITRINSDADENFGT